MIAGHLAARAVGLLVSGVAGAAVIETLKQPATANAARRGLVTVTAWTLRGKRQIENGAENLRLTAGDVVAEARARIGETAPPPAHPAEPHDH